MKKNSIVAKRGHKPVHCSACQIWMGWKFNGKFTNFKISARSCLHSPRYHHSENSSNHTL